MQYREHIIDGKLIAIYDDILTNSELYAGYTYALKSSFRLLRHPSELPEESGYQKTLASYFELNEVINHGILNNDVIKNYLKDNKLRVINYYINLSTSNDTYCYHIDDVEEGCNKTLLCYLNTYWQPNWEGETHFSNSKKQEVLVASSFIPGRVVIFDSTIPHKSTQPSFEAKQFRIALAVKLVGPESKRYNSGVSIEDFFFKKTDIIKNVSATEKKAIKFIEELTHNIQHSNSTLANHLINTYCILKTLGASTDACLAGLYHSIYGTVYFKPELQIEKNTVIDIIGEKAEKLVSSFCEDGDIDYKILNNTSNYNKTTWLELLQIYYANSIEQIYRMSFHFSLENNKLAIIKNKINELQEENKFND